MAPQPKLLASARRAPVLGRIRLDEVEYEVRPPRAGQYAQYVGLLKRMADAAGAPEKGPDGKPIAGPDGAAKWIREPDLEKQVEVVLSILKLVLPTVPPAVFDELEIEDANELVDQIQKVLDEHFEARQKELAANPSSGSISK